MIRLNQVSSKNALLQTQIVPEHGSLLPASLLPASLLPASLLSERAKKLLAGWSKIALGVPIIIALTTQWVNASELIKEELIQQQEESQQEDAQQLDVQQLDVQQEDAQQFESKRFDDLYDFNIPPQPLETALIIYARQANLTLIVPFAQIQGQESSALSGKFTAHEAIMKLLEGTDLDARLTGMFGDGQRAVTISDRAYPEVAIPGTQAVPTQPPVNRDLSKPRMAAGNYGLLAVLGSGRKDRVIADSAVPLRARRGDQLQRISHGDLPGNLADSFAPITQSSSARFTAAQQPNAVLDSLGFGQPLSNSIGISNLGLRGQSRDRLRILLDGHPLPTSYDLASIPALAIDSAQLMLDGGSAQYGSGTVAGALDLRLRQRAEGGDLQVELGSYSYNGDYNMASDSDGLRRNGEAIRVAAQQGFSVAGGFVTLSGEFNDRPGAFAWDQEYERTQKSALLSFEIPTHVSSGSGPALTHAANNTAASNTAASNTAASNTAAGNTAAGNTAAGNTAADESVMTASVLADVPRVYGYLNLGERDDRRTGISNFSNAKNLAITLGLAGDGVLPFSLAGSARLSANDRGDQTNLNYNVSISHISERFTLNSSARMPLPAFDRPDLTDRANRSMQATQTRLRAQWAMGLSTDHADHHLIFGGLLQQDDLKVSLPSTGASDFSAVGRINERRNNIALFAELDSEFELGALPRIPLPDVIAAFVDSSSNLSSVGPQKLITTVALRLDDYESLGSKLSTKFAGRLPITDDLALRASFGRSFTAPTLDASYAGNRVGKLNLENASHRSIGFSYNNSRNLAVSLDWYRNRSDSHDRSNSHNVPFTELFLRDELLSNKEMRQIDTRTSGFDLNVDYHTRLENSQLALRFTHSDAKSTNTRTGIVMQPLPAFDFGHSFGYPPRNRTIIGLDWITEFQNKPLHWSATATRIGRNRSFMPYSGVTVLDESTAAWLIDMDIGYQLSDALFISVGVSNLLNDHAGTQTIQFGAGEQGSSSSGSREPASRMSSLTVKLPTDYHGRYFYTRANYAF